MNQLQSARFSVQAEGELENLQFLSAEGVVTSKGQAWSKARINVRARPEAYYQEFTIADGITYLKDLDGRWVPLERSDSYNPSELLAANRGLTWILGQATDAHGATSELVRGTACYRVQASLPLDAADSLTDLAPGQTYLPSTLWIAKSENRLLKARITFRTRGSIERTTMTLSLSHFDDPTNLFHFDDLANIGVQ